MILWASILNGPTGSDMKVPDFQGDWFEPSQSLCRQRPLLAISASHSAEVPRDAAEQEGTSRPLWPQPKLLWQRLILAKLLLCTWNSKSSFMLSDPGLETFSVENLNYFFLLFSPSSRESTFSNKFLFYLGEILFLWVP